MDKKNILIISLVVCIGIISWGYYDLNEKYSKLEVFYGYAMEMAESCKGDPELCDNIKKKIFESKNQQRQI